ncbi:hypothetical protein V6N13_036745 [Hibiscus sabdariffa]
MSTLEARGPSLRGYRRRKAVLDLNVLPSEIREQDGTSEQAGPEELTDQPVHPAPPETIDVEAIDDDVIESSALAFAEAKNNSRRSRRRAVVDVDSGLPAQSTNNNPNRCRRFLPIHGGGNYKATAISQGTNLQLSNLHGFIKRGDVNKMWAHFLQGMHQSCNSGPGKMPNMQEKSDCQGTNQGLPSISQLNG